LASQPSTPRPPRSQDGSSLSAGSVLEGKLAFSGPVMLSGHVKGDLTTDSLLVVEAGALIEGNVSATIIIVHGKIKGSVSASEAIEAWPGCRLEGRAYAPSMRVEEGASILADLLISPERPAGWLTQGEAATAPAPAPLPAPSASPEPMAAAPRPAPMPSFTNTMFAQPAKSGSGK
jgi:cytoskeletal protein CcmA (bactofilin family)